MKLVLAAIALTAASEFAVADEPASYTISVYAQGFHADSNKYDFRIHFESQPCDTVRYGLDLLTLADNSDAAIQNLTPEIEKIKKDVAKEKETHCKK